jgi:hypothetical protein
MTTPSTSLVVSKKKAVDNEKKETPLNETERMLDAIDDTEDEIEYKTDEQVLMALGLMIEAGFDRNLALDCMRNLGVAKGAAIPCPDVDTRLIAALSKYPKFGLRIVALMEFFNDYFSLDDDIEKEESVKEVTFSDYQTDEEKRD